MIVLGVSTTPPERMETAEASLTVEREASKPALELAGPPPSVTDRYYTKFFAAGEYAAYVLFLRWLFFVVGSPVEDM